MTEDEQRKEKLDRLQQLINILDEKKMDEALMALYILEQGEKEEL